jgi:hypothetical protein
MPGFFLENPKDPDATITAYLPFMGIGSLRPAKKTAEIYAPNTEKGQ